MVFLLLPPALMILRFLDSFECDLEVKANYIVYGDNHLLELKHFHGIQIVDAKAFVEKVAVK